MDKRFCGILAHPTTLPSDYGIGDIKSSFDFVDILSEYKQDFWQILPLGHTSFGDSPYQCFSAFAGNPLLISIDMLIKDGFLTEAQKIDFELDKVEYEKVINYKKSVFIKAFENFKPDKAYNDFCRENAFWLEDYALFISLKEYYIALRKDKFEPKELKDLFKKIKKMSKQQIIDCYYGGSFIFWDEDIKNRQNIDKWKKLLQNEIDYHKFVQYIFFSQWAKLKEYANEKNVKIIGDIPIFVAYDSCDVWANRELFTLDTKGYPKEVAGVPPDYFSETGQLWGNPLYNWQQHKKDGYLWWINRIKHTLKTVDLIRIDHFRAFEDYYSIPFGSETAQKGKWKKGPQHNFFDTILNELGELPIIAEDLGDLTDEVYKLRDYYNLPGMKILHFAFSSSENDYLPHNYITDNFVVYTGTHDNDTTVGWYKALSDKEKDYYRRYLNVDDNNVNKNLIRLAYSSNARYAIIPLCDVLGLDENYRMNTPSVASGNWQVRIRKELFNPEAFEYLLYLKSLFNR